MVGLKTVGKPKGWIEMQIFKSSLNEKSSIHVNELFVVEIHSTGDKITGNKPSTEISNTAGPGDVSNYLSFVSRRVLSQNSSKLRPKTMRKVRKSTRHFLSA